MPVRRVCCAMADYIYLLENRLSAAQQSALGRIRDVARSHDFTVFLTGGAVRDLTGGGSVRDLDVTVQGDAFKLKKPLGDAGARIVGEHAPAQALYLVFPGGVRAEVGSAVSITYPKPGKPKYEPASISDDLRRRDFTANAMALSLNEGSYGLLMDPLNGTADIENRELRLVSNYGFIEDPSRLLRATRLISRLGWQMEERTRARYDTAKEEGYISALGPWAQGYELEEIFHEEDPLRVMRALEAEGWLGALSPALSPAKVNSAGLDELRERQGQLQTQGILAPIAALAFPLLVAKLSTREIAALKASFVRPGFAEEIDSFEAETRQMQTRFTSKEAATPSQVWKMLHSAEPGLVLSMAFSSKSGAVQTRLKTFLTESPSARQRIPYALLAEMRITPDLPVYGELLDKLFFELMDNRLQTVEEMKLFLSPYSPPAPPPPVNLRRARAKKEARPSRAKGKKAAAAAEALTVAEQEESAAVASGLLRPAELAEAGGQGTDPVAPEELAGKVAPLAKPAKQTTPAKPIAPEKAQAAVEPATPKTAKKAVVVAREKPPVLAAKAAPLPKKEAARIAPHPIAAKEIAAKPSKERTSAVSSRSVAAVPAVSSKGNRAKAAAVPQPKKAPQKPGKAAPKPAKPAARKPAKKAAKSSRPMPARRATSAKAATAKATSAKRTSKPAKASGKKAGVKSAVQRRPAPAKVASSRQPAKTKPKAAKKAAPQKPAAKKSAPKKLVKGKRR